MNNNYKGKVTNMIYVIIIFLTSVLFAYVGNAIDHFWGASFFWILIYVVWNASKNVLYKFVKTYCIRRREESSNRLRNSCFAKATLSIDGYDYYDHSGGYYLNNMIAVEIDESEKCIYDFNRSIEDNINRIPKLKDISEFVKKIIGADLVRILNEESQLVLKSKSITNNQSLIVRKMLRGRQDYEENREAAYLRIILVHSDERTIGLIDSIFNLLKERYEQVLTPFVKKVPDFDSRCKRITLSDLFVFFTSFKLNGILVQRDNGIYLVNKGSSGQLYSYSVSIPHKTDKIVYNGKDFQDLIKKESLLEKSNPHTFFTDICISYITGLHIELLSYTTVSKVVNVNNNIPNNSEKLQKYVREVYKNKDSLLTSRDAHFFQYLKNVFRRLDRE